MSITCKRCGVTLHGAGLYCGCDRMRYREALHVEGLLGILEDHPHPIFTACPSSQVEEAHGRRVEEQYDKETCDICWGFLQETFPDTVPLMKIESCPCIKLGKELAVKLTWLALEDQGYLD